MRAVIDRSDAPLVARAAVLGTTAGCLEGLLVLETGVMPPFELLLNLCFVAASFSVAALLWVAASRRRFGAMGDDVMLLLLCVLSFALRGCLHGCDASLSLRVGIPLAAFVAALTAQGVVRRRYPALASRSLLFVATVVLTIAALDFAQRDGLVGSEPVFTRVAALMAGLATLNALAAGRGARVKIALGATIGLGLLIWSSDKVRPPALPIPTPVAPPRDGAGVMNVVVIVMDTVRADHTSPYGYSRRTMPGLEALASESLVFERAISSGTYSLPSHASLFTGVLPGRHGAHVRVRPGALTLETRRTDSALLPDVETLASTLKARSFATAGISANYVYLADWTGLRRGFDGFDSRPRRQLGYHPMIFPLLRRLGVRTLATERIEWDAPSVTRAAADFSRGVQAPFFLFINYFDAHAPYFRRPGASFRGDGRGRDDNQIPAYDSELAYLDRSLTAFVDELRGSGLLDRTLLVITSDHGEFFGEHGFFLHGMGAYEEVLRIPLIVRFPGKKMSGRVARPFGLHEVKRLIMDTLDGRSLDWIDTPPETPRVLAQIWTRASVGDRMIASPTVEPFANIIYGWPFKLIARRTGVDELYNLAEDPREHRNLLASGAPEARSEQSRLRAALADLPPAREGLDPNIPADDLAALRGLGYISLRRPGGR